MHCRKTVGIFFNRFSARNRSVPRWEFVQSFVKLPTCQMASGDWNWPGGLGPPSRSVFPGIPTKTFSCILTYLHTAYIFLKKLFISDFASSRRFCTTPLLLKVLWLPPLPLHKLWHQQQLLQLRKMMILEMKWYLPTVTVYVRRYWFASQNFKFCSWVQEECNFYSAWRCIERVK